MCLINKMFEIIKQKYNFFDIDKDILSSRVDLIKVENLYEQSQLFSCNLSVEKVLKRIEKWN